MESWLSGSVSLRRLTVVFLDVAAVAAAFVLAFLLRFDFHLDSLTLDVLIRTVPYVVIIYFAASVVFSLYRGIYHYSSFTDLTNIAKAVASSAVVSAALVLFVQHGVSWFPRSVIILHPILAFLGIGAIRLSVRFGKNYMRFRNLPTAGQRRMLIVGAGDLGESLLRQVLKTPALGYQAAGFIDDDARKWGMYLHGVPVLGGREALPRILAAQAVDEIVIAISSRRGEIVRSVVEEIRHLKRKPEIKVAPSLDEVLRRPFEGVMLRKVRPSDLLNREAIRLDLARIEQVFQGQCILVTGAGGTIGGELCRQALQYRPRKLVFIDSHATSLFYQEAEMREKAHGVELAALLCDVRDAAQMEKVFQEHRPDVVLHAAAHKHVHQLETNIEEGVSNNFLGTYRVAELADRFGVKAFLLVSTDKAVRPSSVMGATKRAAEHVVEHFAKTSGTRFVAVRFGNVLGSSGSVLQIFQEQISKGGPLTVTDERATRFFMTVEEAVGLILQAVSMAKGGEVFILKMGTPVSILEMAKNLILLCGLEPEKDIEIRLTGLKPGEKLHEEVVEDASRSVDSAHPHILVLVAADRTPDVKKEAASMEALISSRDRAALLSRLREIVPTYEPSETAARSALPAGR